MISLCFSCLIMSSLVKMSPRTLLNRCDYCQFLLSSQKNFTLTYFADHSERYSHDQINRYLNFDNITPADIWAEAKHHVVFSENGYLLFDDTVVDKNYSSKIEMVRRQYSGNAGRPGTCVWRKRQGRDALEGRLRSERLSRTKPC